MPTQLKLALLIAASCTTSATTVRGKDPTTIDIGSRRELFGQDGGIGEITCVSISKDGITWTRPKLGLFEINGSKDNNCSSYEAKTSIYLAKVKIETSKGEANE